MVKELTDRVKEEIVKTQIDFIKNNYPHELINYDKLGEYLTESISGYSSKELELNEKLAEEGKRLLIKEMETRYLNLTKSAQKFLEAKKDGKEEKSIQTGKMIMFGPIGFDKSYTPKSNFREALDNYKAWAKHIEGFGLSVGWCGINVESYEEALK